MADDGIRRGSVHAEASGWWEERVFEWLRERPRPAPTSWDLAVTVPAQVESDPLYTRQVPHTWAGAWRWFRDCFAYAIRASSGELREFPEQRWQLAGVKLFEARGGFIIEPKGTVD